MPNHVAQSTIAAVRPTADGAGHLLRLRVRLEPGGAGDLDPGWYVINLPIQNLRPLNGTDDPFSNEEIIADESRPVEERLAALRAEQGG